MIRDFEDYAHDALGNKWFSGICMGPTVALGFVGAMLTVCLIILGVVAMMARDASAEFMKMLRNQVKPSQEATSDHPTGNSP